MLTKHINQDSQGAYIYVCQLRQIRNYPTFNTPLFLQTPMFPLVTIVKNIPCIQNYRMQENADALLL